ncbi:hypothetical protein D3C85_1490960 [compost metagenome]
MYMFRRFSCARGGSGQRMCTPSSGRTKSSGIFTSTRRGSTSTTAEESTFSAMVFSATQQPL